jgi:hypothetical protein
VKDIIKDKMVGITARVEQLKQYKQNGNTVAAPVPFGLQPGEKKYKAPKVAEKRSKKDKKTWDKF